MTKLYRESDVQPHGLGRLKVVVVGYGSQGRGQALNLRDSGANVSVATRPGGPSWQQAEEEGWQPIPLEDAAADADLVCFLTPDMAQPEVYEKYFAGKLKSGATVLFSHGFNVHYGFTQFPEDTNVVHGCAQRPRLPGTARVRKRLGSPLPAGRSPGRGRNGLSATRWLTPMPLVAREPV